MHTCISTSACKYVHVVLIYLFLLCFFSIIGCYLLLFFCLILSDNLISTVTTTQFPHEAHQNFIWSLNANNALVPFEGKYPFHLHQIDYLGITKSWQVFSFQMLEIMLNIPCSFFSWPMFTTRSWLWPQMASTLSWTARRSATSSTSAMTPKRLPRGYLTRLGSYWVFD